MALCELLYVERLTLTAPFVFFSMRISGFFFKTQVFIGRQIYVWIFNSTPFVNVSVSISVLFCFYYQRFIVKLEVGDGVSSNSFLIIQEYYSYSGFLAFLMKLKIILSRLAKKCVVIWEGIALIMQMSFGRMAIVSYANLTDSFCYLLQFLSLLS